MSVHHIVAFLFACNNILGVCDGVWDFYNGDLKCMHTYRPLYAHTNMWSVGYFAFDSMLLLFVLDDLKTALGKQTLAHHFLGAFCIIGGMYQGHAAPLLAQSCMLSEISGVFLSIRNTIGKDAEGVFAFVNNIMFFVTFTIFRIIHFPFPIYNYLKSPYEFNWEGFTTFNYIFHYILASAFFGICFLNIYWY